MSRWICSIYFTETMATAARWLGEEGGGGWYSGFQVTGKERGKNEKRKESLGLPPEPNQIALPKLTPKNPMINF